MRKLFDMILVHKELSQKFQKPSFNHLLEVEFP